MQLSFRVEDSFSQEGCQEGVPVVDGTSGLRGLNDSLRGTFSPHFFFLVLNDKGGEIVH